MGPIATTYDENTSDHDLCLMATRGDSERAFRVIYRRYWDRIYRLSAGYAKNPDDANDIAQDNGVYFNGCSKGWDCDCCGDRWYACDDSDGDDSPSIHNTPVADYRSRYGADGHPTAAVVYKDGTTVTHP